MPASVRKAALVLDLFSVERPDWGPTEVADELGIAKSSAHALLDELARAGLTDRLPCGRHRLGWRLVALAQAKLITSGYREAITPTARRLASHFGETVHIAAWERGRVLYVASQRPPGGVAAPAEPVAAHLTPPGTVLLAERAGAGSGLEPGELERTRGRGYAVGAQRALEGVDCAAAPVRASDGPATAALALCAPHSRFQARRDEYTRAIAGAGERISRSVRR
ncbi:MAG TPA: helix-turn-helix domain-containing protein [Jatrophihabitans sp.]|jgi:DNA-binding IclR family transcriptional regulator|nr:helix-turn-helix domain-containing protein [Jatrophihabitans sp.]